MTYRVLKDYKPHEFKKGDIVGIPPKDKVFIEKLTKDGIIEPLGIEETKGALDKINGKDK